MRKSHRRNKQQLEAEIPQVQTRASLKEQPKRKDAAMAKGSFPVVAIGATVGGLEAYKEFLLAQPLETGMAFVLIPASGSEPGKAC
jgi:chemotaxis response regulator CheB